MRLLYCDPKHKPVIHEMGGQRVPLDQLLRDADFVTVHVRLSPETTHLIGERELGLMKPSAGLVNVARGPVIDEAALVRALAQRRIAWAGLDVFELEPKLAAGLAELPNVVLAPHIGSATFEAREAMARKMVNDCIAILAGRPPLHPVPG